MTPHVITLEEMAWGIALIAVTMTLHAFAMPATLATCHVLLGGMIAIAGLLTFA